MPRKRIATDKPPPARKIAPQRKRVSEKPPRTSDEKMGPFLPDSLEDDEDEDEPGATIECQNV